MDIPATLPAEPDGHAPAWDDLRVFHAVVDAGTIAGAALAENLSKLTVSRRLRELETTLGVSLFERGANRLSLTEAGATLHEATLPMRAAARAIPALMALHQTSPRQPLRITATGTVTLFLSMHLTLLQDMAGVRRIELLPTRRTLDLTRGEADIALRMRALPVGQELVARRIGAISFALYRNRNLPPGPVIGTSTAPEVSRISAYLARIVPDRPVVGQINETNVRFQAAKAGIGAACLPCWLADTDPDLVRDAAPANDLVEDVYLLTRPLKPSDEPIRAVADTLVALFRKHAGALAGRVR